MGVRFLSSSIRLGDTDRVVSQRPWMTPSNNEMQLTRSAMVNGMPRPSQLISVFGRPQ
jgi:hypothetical protein